MKCKSLWVNFSTHDNGKFRLKPSYLRSQIIYNLGGKMWLAPHLEFCWLFLVFQFTLYSMRKEYNSGYYEHECPEQMLQDRINVLENAIRQHKKSCQQPDEQDMRLWSSLG